MSLASELLHSTSKRRSPDGSPERSGDHIRRLFALDHVVHGLISEHEPTPGINEQLRADLRCMHLSGLVNAEGAGVVTRVCKQAAAVMADLTRLLPRCKE